MKKLDILIADDESIIRLGLKQILEEAGHTVYTAENGVSAVRMADSIHPDLVVLDIKMPEMDGLEAARLIYDQSAGADHLLDRLRRAVAHRARLTTPGDGLLDQAHQGSRAVGHDRSGYAALRGAQSHRPDCGGAGRGSGARAEPWTAPRACSCSARASASWTHTTFCRSAPEPSAAPCWKSHKT